VLVREGSEDRSAAALEVISLAERGEVLGEARSLRFHRTTANLAVRLTDSNLGPVGELVARDGERLVPLTASDDHVVIDQDWFPIAADSLRVAQGLLGGAASSVVTFRAYADLFRGLDQPIDVIDELSAGSFAQVGDETEQGVTALELYPYQQDGLRWLMAHAGAGFGGILADEMGLGKTPQAIALLEQERRQDRGPNLVIAPKTLIENWSRELLRFAPMIRFYRHIGPKRVRRPGPLNRVDTVITSYDLAVLDRGLLGAVAWNVVITDEAQAYKNPATRRAAAIASLPRKTTIALTGTPLENRPLDLWSISEVVEPGFLGTRSHFDRVYEEAPSLLRGASRPLLLRREVAEVAADLPEKINIDVALEMFGPEAAEYDALIDRLKAERKGILGALTTLRQFTGHPHAAGMMSGVAAPTASVKLTRLLEIVEEIALSDEKFILFSTFHAVTDIVQASVRSRLAIPVSVIDGRTPHPVRQEILDAFEVGKGSAGLVLSPAVAGVGLNIVAANHVIHYTLEWNPAKEDQATARAWRRGQQRPVTVHRLLYQGTIDEAINERLTYKRAVFEEAVGPVGVESIAEMKQLLDAAFARRASRLEEET
jgi:SNF2 family DNA or RNA helicase